MDSFQLVLHGDVLNVLDEHEDVHEEVGVGASLDVLEHVVASSKSDLDVEALDFVSKGIGLSALSFWSSDGEENGASE